MWCDNSTVCDSVLLDSVESYACLSDSMPNEVGGCSAMVSSRLMNYLESTIHFKNNCKYVSEF